MKSRSNGFNIYLLAVALALAAGCKTPEEKRLDDMSAVVRFYLGTTPDSTGKHQTVEISGVQVHANKTPVLDESSIASALVVSTKDGGYALQIDFDDHGKLVLDSLTASSKGRHLVIFTQFGVKKTVQDRWLAAPLITQRLAEGRLIFTPNATREEAVDIALGINNVVKERTGKAWWR